MRLLPLCLLVASCAAVATDSPSWHEWPTPRIGTRFRVCKHGSGYCDGSKTGEVRNPLPYAITARVECTDGQWFQMVAPPNGSVARYFMEPIQYEHGQTCGIAPGDWHRSRPGEVTR